MGTRFDVSGVAPQGGYLAKRCPVRAQLDILRPGEPLAPSQVAERRMAQGRAFEAEVVAALVLAHPSAALIEPTWARETRENATTQAMAEGVGLIVGGRLPVDEAGRRVGEPDLLVRALTPGPPTYRAVDVKHHMVLEAGPPDGRPGLVARCCELYDPTLEASVPDERWAARKRREDLLQLAHYQRMLEAMGAAAGDGCWGGIIGVEGRVVWYDLDAPLWKTPSSTRALKARSSMEIYDFEFDFRLDIMAVAQSHLDDASIRPLMVPVRIAECPDCPWWTHCSSELHAGSGDVSLLPGLGWKPWRIHREHGVCNRAALAGLDVVTAELVCAGVDLAPVLAAAAQSSPDTPVSELVSPKRKAQLACLYGAGIDTAAQVLALDPTAAAYSGSRLSGLVEQIEQARAALGPEPAYRRRGIDSLVVPRGDVEVDVDMENVEDGVYLWGTLLSDPGATGLVGSGYRGFVSWDTMSAETEQSLFVDFWTWFAHLHKTVSATGARFRAYCYTGAENSQLRRLGIATGLIGEVEAFIASEHWVDLYRVFGAQLITGSSLGLKTLASLAGFAWEVDDPGGELSMLRYEEAVGSEQPAERGAARDWLIAYNRNDVQATLALRNWMCNIASHLPLVGS